MEFHCKTPFPCLVFFRLLHMWKASSQINLHNEKYDPCPALYSHLHWDWGIQLSDLSNPNKTTNPISWASFTEVFADYCQLTRQADITHGNYLYIYSQGGGEWLRRLRSEDGWFKPQPWQNSGMFMGPWARLWSPRSRGVSPVLTLQYESQAMAIGSAKISKWVIKHVCC